MWFGRSENDLVVSFLGNETQTKVVGWFSNPASAVDSIELESGGSSIDAAGIQALVSAMASFSTSNGVPQQGTLPGNYEQAVTLAIGSSWA